MTMNIQNIAGALALTAAVAVGFVPTEADATTGYGLSADECYGEEGWNSLDVLSKSIPSDGVLVLQGAFTGSSPVLENITIGVSTGGDPVAGALEVTDFNNILLWRPEAAWAPGEYEVSGVIVNPESGGCVAPEVQVAGAFTVEAEPLGELVAPEVSGMTAFQLIPQATIDTLVCCPGASPPAQDGCEGLSFGDGCAATQGVGVYDVMGEATAAAEGAGAGQVLYTLTLDGSPFQTSPERSFSLFSLISRACVQMSAKRIGSDEVVTGAEVCFGDDLLEKLGPQPIDPGDTLACEWEICPLAERPDDVCGGRIWDCAGAVTSTDGETDPPPTTGAETDDPGATEGTEGTGGAEAGAEGGSNGEKGCACTADPASGPGASLLAFAALLGLRRRRRG